jgi:hypothetical protein
MVESPYKSGTNFCYTEKIGRYSFLGYYILYAGINYTAAGQALSVSITFLALERVFGLLSPVKLVKKFFPKFFLKLF